MPSAEMVLFSNSGSEATYHAIRVSRAATGRPLVVKFQGCYHGWHDYLGCERDQRGPSKIGQNFNLSPSADAAPGARLARRAAVQRHRGARGADALVAGTRWLR